MKKISALLVLALMLAGLSGCGGEGADSTGSSSLGAGGSENMEGELVVSTWESNYQSALDEIAEEFNKLYPNVSIEYQPYPSSNESYTGLTVALQSGTMPDLFVTHGSKNEYLPTYVSQGAVMCLDGLIDTDGFDETAINFATIDGKLYASPGAFADSFCAFYNKKIFAENNLSVPETYDDFLNICETLKSNGITPISLAGNDMWGPCMLENAMSSVIAPDWVDDFAAGTASVDDERFKAVIEAIKYLADSGYFAESYMSYDEASAIDEFVTGNSAMFTTGQWNVSSVEINEDVDVFYIPSKDGTIHVSSGVSTQTGFSISSDTEYPDAAVEFLKFYIKPESLQKIADLGEGGVPIREGVTSDNAMFNELSNYDVAHPLWLDLLGNKAIDGVDPMSEHLLLLQSMLAGNKTVDDVIQETVALLE